MRRAVWATASGVALLVLAGCGGATDTAAPDAVPSASSSSSESPGDNKKAEREEGDTSSIDTSASVLPSVTVKDVETGSSVRLDSLVPSDTPVLLWAWAPHCPICAGEAPAVEAFASKHADSVTVVGVGTQDDFALAEDFVSTYGVRTPQMLWDPGFESWQALKITGQPTWVLLSPGGEEIDRWQGGLPEDDILSRI